MRNFTVIQGEKPEEKPFDLGPRPDYLRQRTYEDALAVEKSRKALGNIGSASELARYAWFVRPLGGSSATPGVAKNDP